MRGEERSGADEDVSSAALLNPLRTSRAPHSTCHSHLRALLLPAAVLPVTAAPPNTSSSSSSSAFAAFLPRLAGGLDASDAFLFPFVAVVLLLGSAKLGSFIAPKLVLAAAAAPRPAAAPLAPPAPRRAPAAAAKLSSRLSSSASRSSSRGASFARPARCAAAAALRLRCVGIMSAEPLVLLLLLLLLLLPPEAVRPRAALAAALTLDPLAFRLTPMLLDPPPPLPGASCCCCWCWTGEEEVEVSKTLRRVDFRRVRSMAGWMLLRPCWGGFFQRQARWG